ncbi:conserved hypothetical protein [Theileria orientalis strain Shintoku]|uniref:Uncharacterized protein n=1 Tax=Theileria orientalis strain Shintoku TaxID=869250 RepID=J4CE22_THEOR|nr:conserved hypothetical protein [Theileria orientalis strain Shintoku]BAM42137.1 conserved hypothetical protein [Theileria orientalis strain Shintoku]|eukprot:XP_009692438.1 conserved hypothetical protein [Theileria orientalis strain Shintoku]
MKGLYKFLVVIYMCTRSCVAVNNHKNNSFLNLLSNDKAFSPATEPEAPEEAPEKPSRGSPKTTIEKIKGLFKTEDKVSTKRQNNALVMEFEGYKNVRNKKEVDVNHLQVQKSNNMFTNNTDKGVLHFTSDLGKLSGKGSVTRATLKLNKLFDAKNFGFACKSNAVNLFLIEAPAEDLKLKTVKGPIKLEFKKDEMEFDITKFFEDLDDSAAPGPGPAANLSGTFSYLSSEFARRFQRTPNHQSTCFHINLGAATLLQFTDLSDNDDDLGFEDEKTGSSAKGGSDESDDDFFDKKSTTTEEPEGDSPAVKGAFDRYLMLEADDGCYFGFDVDKNKPNVKIELSKKVVNRTKGKYKTASITALGLTGVGLIGVVGYLLKKRKTEHTFVFDNSQNEVMAGY